MTRMSRVPDDMSSIFGKDRQFMSDIELDASLVDLNRNKHRQAPFNADDLDASTKPNFQNHPYSQPSSFAAPFDPPLANNSNPPPASNSQRNFQESPQLIDLNEPSYRYKPSNGPYTAESPVPSDVNDNSRFNTIASNQPLIGPPLKPQRTTSRPSEFEVPHAVSMRSLKSVARDDMSPNINSRPESAFNPVQPQPYQNTTLERNYNNTGTFPRGLTSGMFTSQKSLASALPNESAVGEMAPLRGFSHPCSNDDDDRRTHVSIAASVMSTVPLATEPSASKTVSGLYGLLFTIIGIVLSLGEFFSETYVYPQYVDFFAMYMFGAGCLACLYIVIASLYSKRQSRAPVDHHNGSIYIRIGAMVFCICSLLHSGIMIGEMFQYSNDCYVVWRSVHIGLRAAFQFFQLFVVMLYSKVCIQSWQSFARICLAHIIASNFYMWFVILLKETKESIAVSVPFHYHRIRFFCQRNYANSFTDIEEESTPILFPASVAYCVISGCMLYIMWKNVGKNYSDEHREESQDEHDKTIEFDFKEGAAGIIFGSFVLVVSISAVVVFILFSDDKQLKEFLVAGYHGYAGFWLVILSLAFPIATCTLKRHKKQDHYHNNLNRPILIVCTAGVFAYCILSVMSGALALLERQSILAIATVSSYSLQAIQTAFQTIYLLDGLRRCPRKRINARPSKSLVIFFLLVNVALWILIIFELKEDSMLNPLQESFYGIINWCIVLHIVGPIASLYRFHSVCCLLDVWKFAY